MKNAPAVTVGTLTAIVLLAASAARITLGHFSPHPSNSKVIQTLDISKRSEVADESQIDNRARIKPATLNKSIGSASAAGLTLVCSLYGAHDQGTGNYDVPQPCDLPVGFKLDWKYQQKSISCAGGGATSDVAPGDVPRGIHLVCDGGYYWAIHKPVVLAAVSWDDAGNINQWRVIVPMYCGPGAPGQGGCNIKVYVYAASL